MDTNREKRETAARSSSSTASGDVIPAKAGIQTGRDPCFRGDDSFGMGADEDRGGAAAPKFWRSLGEVTWSREFQAFAAHEFPYGASREPETLSRRDVLRLGAASAALAGLTACTKLPTEKIVPYAAQEPEEFTP